MSIAQECANYAQTVKPVCAIFAQHTIVRFLHNWRMDTSWIKKQMRALKVTQADVAARLHRDRSVISRIINGEQPMQLDEVPVFAELLQIPIAEMLQRAGLPTGQGVFSPNVELIDRPVIPVRVIGDVEAGIFRPADERHYDDQDIVYITADPALQGIPLFALRVRGPSMNRIYPDGSTVICAPLLHLGDGFTLKTGHKVIVERRNEFSDVESTVKEIVFESATSAWLWPRSDHPEFQQPWHMPLGNGDELNDTDHIRISAIVTHAIKREF